MKVSDGCCRECLVGEIAEVQMVIAALQRRLDWLLRCYKAMSPKPVTTSPEDASTSPKPVGMVEEDILKLLPIQAFTPEKQHKLHILLKLKARVSPVLIPASPTAFDARNHSPDQNTLNSSNSPMSSNQRADNIADKTAAKTLGEILTGIASAPMPQPKIFVVNIPATSSPTVTFTPASTALPMSEQTGDDDLALIVDYFAKDFNLQTLPRAPPTAAAQATATPAKPTMRDIVMAAVDADNKHRFKGVTGDLHPISSIKFPEEWQWDSSIPVLHHEDPLRMFQSEHSVTTLSHFKTQIASVGLQWLEKVMTMTGLKAAGGAVSTIINGHAASINDVDLFQVNMDEDTCDQAIVTTAGILRDAWGGPLTIYRTETCITFRHGEFTGGGGWVCGGNSGETCGHCKYGAQYPLVQIILRRYSTLSEVLHGFDNGACAVAYDGGQVWFTSLAKLAYEHRVNVLDLSRRRASYERRLAKYYSRGFGLVLPDLDLEKVRNGIKKNYWERRVVMSNMEFFPARVEGSHVVVSSIGAFTGPAAQKAAEAEPKSDADTETGEKKEEAVTVEDKNSEYGAIPYKDMVAIATRNLVALQRDQVRTRTLCGWRAFSAEEIANLTIKDIKDIAPCFNLLSDAIQRHCMPFRINMEKLVALVGKGMAGALAKCLADGKTINWDRLAEKLITITAPRAVIPWKYMQVEADTALIGPFLKAPVPLAEYYGDFYRIA